MGSSTGLPFSYSSRKAVGRSLLQCSVDDLGALQSAQETRTSGLVFTGRAAYPGGQGRRLNSPPDLKQAHSMKLLVPASRLRQRMIFTLLGDTVDKAPRQVLAGVGTSASGCRPVPLRGPAAPRGWRMEVLQLTGQGPP